MDPNQFFLIKGRPSRTLSDKNNGTTLFHNGCCSVFAPLPYKPTRRVKFPTPWKYFTLGSQSLRDKICAMSQRKVTPQCYNSYSIQVLKRGVHVKLERRKKPTVKKLFICKSQIEQKFLKNVHF